MFELHSFVHFRDPYDIFFIFYPIQHFLTSLMCSTKKVNSSDTRFGLFLMNKFVWIWKYFMYL